MDMIKFVYSEKATNSCKISTLDLSYVVMVKSTVEISQNFMAFSEYMNFKGAKPDGQIEVKFGMEILKVSLCPHKEV